MTTTLNYFDFDLKIERTPQGYRVQVTDSPSGNATTDFVLPFSDLEIENFLLKLGGTRRTVRRIESPEMEAAKHFGGKLFNAVFSGDVRGCYASSLTEADAQGAGLRVRLHLNAVPELADLPWEYLYNASLNRFLVLSVKTPLIRFLEIPERIRPLAVKPPLRVLVMISSPTDYDSLDVEREWSSLKNALADLEQRGVLMLERMTDATLASLQKHLQTNTYHILHFVGHGGFDERTQDGVLIFEDNAERGRRVSAQDLGTLLHDHGSLRLVLLNACEGARTSRTDPFAGVAPSLVQQGVPAVIAMQFEISDEAANVFAAGFYQALAMGMPVDAALSEVRKTIFANNIATEWGTPVLYMRAPDGKIFDIDANALNAPPVLPAPIVPAPIVSAPPPATAPPKVETAPASAPPASGIPKQYLIAGGIGAVLLLIVLGIIFSGAFGGRDKPPLTQVAKATATDLPAQTVPVVNPGKTSQTDATVVPPVQNASATPTRATPTITSTPVTPSITPTRGTPTNTPTIDPNAPVLPTPVPPTVGKIVFMGNRDGNAAALYTYIISSKRSFEIPIDRTKFQDELVSAPQLAHNGKSLVFTGFLPGSKIRIVTSNSTGGNQKTLNTDGAWSDDSPAWSQDDAQLAFATNRDGNYEIYSMKKDGTGAKRLTTTNSSNSTSPSWSPDGKQIVFSEKTTQGNDLYVITLSTPTARPQGLVRTNDVEELDPTWSPKGDWIAYTARNASAGWARVRLYRVRDGRIVDLPCPNGKFCISPAWSPDQTAVAFIVLDVPNAPNGRIYYTASSGKSAAVPLLTGVYANATRLNWGPEN